MCGNRSSSPTRVLQNYSVAVGIFERFSLNVPIRIECLDGRIAELLEPLRGFLPLLSIGNVKHQKIVLTGRFPRRMPKLPRELEVISCCPMTQHNAIEAVVIVEFIKNFEAEAISIEFYDRGELIRGSRQPQMSFRETHRNVIRFSHLLCQVLLWSKQEGRRTRTIPASMRSVRTAAHLLAVSPT